MIIYTDQVSKKTRKQKEKERAAWLAQCQRDGLMENGKKFVPIKPVAPAAIRDGAEDYKKCQSLKTNESDCSRPKDRVYTGTEMIGIATMHKSNLVPVFSTDSAKDISKMRRG